MIWRKPFQSETAYDGSVPVMELFTLDSSNLKLTQPYVLIGGTEFNALTEQNIWWRLMQEDFPKFGHVYRVFFKVAKSRSEEAAMMVPRSETPQTILCPDQVADLLDSNQPSRSFAALVSQGKYMMLVKGLPTEDCWEEFSNLLRSELDRSGGRQNL